MQNKNLMMAAMLAMTMGEVFPQVPSSRRTYDGPEPPMPENRGRRAEKDAAALAKADKKRKRKAAKRTGHNVELTGSGQVHRPESSDRGERG